VLDARGKPLRSGGEEDPSTPGLHFIGYLNPLSGRLRSMGFEARRIARAVGEARRQRVAA
jgi:putative flavoprotein involved in K+ transport